MSNAQERAVMQLTEGVRAAVRSLDYLILLTPSGDRRNTLTEVNILILTAQEKMKEIGLT